MKAHALVSIFALAAGCAAPAAKDPPVGVSTAPPDPTGSSTFAEFPVPVNRADSVGRTVYLSLDGQTCFIRRSEPISVARAKGHRMVADDAPCLTGMLTDSAWQACRGGSIHTNLDRSKCVCLKGGDSALEPTPCPPAR